MTTTSKKRATASRIARIEELTARLSEIRNVVEQAVAETRWKDHTPNISDALAKRIIQFTWNSTPPPPVNLPPLATVTPSDYEPDADELAQLQEQDRKQAACPHRNWNRDSEDGCLDCGHDAK